MGLPDVFNYLSYVIFEQLIVQSGNSYRTSIMLAGRFSWICIMCTELVTLIVSPMYSVEVLLGGGTDSVCAFRQQWYVVRLRHTLGSSVMYRWRIMYAGTFAEMLPSH